MDGASRTPHPLVGLAAIPDVPDSQGVSGTHGWHTVRKSYPQDHKASVGIGDVTVGIGEENRLFPWGLAIHYN